MFAGHLAAALGAKRAEPRMPLGAAVAAAFCLDLLWPILLLLGVESVRVDVGDTAFTSLSFDSYLWSHSLLVVTGWSALAGLLGRVVSGSWRVGAVLGSLVLTQQSANTAVRLHRLRLNSSCMFDGGRDTCIRRVFQLEHLFRLAAEIGGRQIQILKRHTLVLRESGIVQPVNKTCRVADKHDRQAVWF